MYSIRMSASEAVLFPQYDSYASRINGLSKRRISSSSTTRLAVDFMSESQSTQVWTDSLALNIGLVLFGCHLKVVREASAWQTADWRNISKQWSAIIVSQLQRGAVQRHGAERMSMGIEGVTYQYAIPSAFLPAQSYLDDNSPYNSTGAAFSAQ